MKSAMHRFHDTLKTFETAMLVTHRHPRGEEVSTDAAPLHVRPMAIAEVNPNCELAFFTLIGSPKSDEIGLDSHVQIICQNRSVFVSITGRAALNRDPAQIARLWKDSYKTWFPKGKADPDLVLMNVRPDEGELWDQHGASTLRHLFDAAKAFVTGVKPEVEEEHAKARLSPPRP